MKKIIITCILAGLSVAVWAQQQVMFTQYMFNQMAFNPAYTGIHDGVSASAIMRQQWVGFDGAPNTQAVSIHSPIGFTPMSLGGMILRDQIGSTTQHGVYFTYAYRIMLRNHSKISFGLQGELTQYRQQYSASVSSDPTVANSNLNVLRPNFGAGIMWHSDRFYLGLGIPMLVRQQFDPNNSYSDSEIVRHYYLSGGYVFALSPVVMFKPNFLVKMVEGSPVEVDLNANFLFKDLIWAGISYRSLESFDALIQLQLGDRFQLGYSFDFFTTTDISKVASGSHEIMLNYVIDLPRTKIKTPRYF